MSWLPRFELIDNWRDELRRLWSVRLALYLALANGALLGLAAFVGIIDPWLFLGLNIAGNLLVALLRLLKQKERQRGITS